MNPHSIEKKSMKAINTKTRNELRRFRNSQPRRYQPVQEILKKTADNLAYTVPSVCGSKNPKIREVAVEVDFKGEVPVATLRARYLRKWTKWVVIPVELPHELNFTPVAAS